jgi:mono/diheme cytochrome c family protein
MRNLTVIALICLAIPVTAGAQSITRGKYIVERTSMCADCHTPRDEKGQLIAAQSLKGSPVGMKPIHPMPWAEFAPPIAGLPVNFTPAQMVKFLQTGIRPDGTTPRPPMPPYRFSHEDAVAVTSYLRSMKQ